MAYQGTVELISGITPKNNGSFKLVNAADVYVSDNESLAQRLSSLDPSNYVSINTTSLINYYTKTDVDDRISAISSGGSIDLGGYATLESPNFTGTPTAPTALSSTNSTQIATTAFVKNVLGSYLTSADAANTYLTSASLSNYLTKAEAAQTYLTAEDLSDDYLTADDAAATYLSQTSATATYLTQSNAATTYLTQTDAANTYLTQTDAAATYLTEHQSLSAYAKKASPTFTGTPKAPTATNVATSTTQIATTAFVHNVVNATIKKVSITIPSGSTNYTYEDAWITADTECISHTLDISGINTPISWTFGVGAVSFSLESEISSSISFDFSMMNAPT